MMTRPAKAPRATTRPRLELLSGGGLLVLALACSPPRSPGSSPHVSDELASARAFDQQGVLAFESGRYRDALLYFQAAFTHGGPPSERWNAAKCYLRLDEPEEAETELVSYLALAGLTPDDAREGGAALDGLRRRSSTLTVTSTPLRLPVRVDGRRVGVTPVSLQVAPGEHVVVVDRDATTRDARRVSAHLGHAILVEARP
jgi:hypothetical protein